jgi:nitrogen-specific signal transduction histidine kinase/ActR/RegA family two-component response regulator
VDISCVKRAAEERIILDNSIREAQKLESLAVMAGGIAHDFNNLLMIILGNAELAMRGRPSAEIAECLQAISGAGQRASELSRMMLTYAGRSGVSLRPVVLGELLKGMKAAVEAILPKQIALEYQTDGQNLLADLDHAQMQQLVVHLVNNAVEAIGEAPGSIRVAAGGRMMTRQEFKDAVLGQDKPDGLYAFIEVADSGCGMDAEGRKHLFEPFYSTKSAGRGLGLSAVLGITRAHGGGIVVGSAPGCGTKITVYLPAREQPENVAKAAPAQAAPSECEFPVRTQKHTGSLGTILVVDDEESIRDLVQHVLEMGGYSVVSAADGVAALSCFQKDPDQFSAAFLDLKMPHMDGYEVIRCIHRVRPDLPIIVLTGYNEEEATGRLAVNEIAAFLQKPCETGALLQTLKSVLARPTPTDPVWMP